MSKKGNDEDQDADMTLAEKLAAAEAEAAPLLFRVRSHHQAPTRILRQEFQAGEARENGAKKTGAAVASEATPGSSTPLTSRSQVMPRCAQSTAKDRIGSAQRLKLWTCGCFNPHRRGDVDEEGVLGTEEENGRASLEPGVCGGGATGSWP